jgi:hypothetical protein
MDATGRSVLCAMLCVMLCAGSTLSASAAQPRSSRSDAAIAQAGYLRTFPLARASDEEAEEQEEEMPEGGEEAATAEVEAEEAEGGEAVLPTSASASSIVISQLKLTPRATAALTQRLPSASSIGFSFTLSAPASLHVAIVRQASTSGSKRWATLPDSLTLSVGQGHVSRSLKGHNHLSAGRYRLTLKPAGGRSRSIYLSVRR